MELKVKIAIDLYLDFSRRYSSISISIFELFQIIFQIFCGIELISFCVAFWFSGRWSAYYIYYNENCRRWRTSTRTPYSFTKSELPKAELKGGLPSIKYSRTKEIFELLMIRPNEPNSNSSNLPPKPSWPSTFKTQSLCINKPRMLAKIQFSCFLKKYRRPEILSSDALMLNYVHRKGLSFNMRFQLLENSQLSGKLFLEKIFSKWKQGWKTEEAPTIFPIKIWTLKKTHQRN